MARRLIASIHEGDDATYAALTTEDVSCYEDVCSHRIDGLEFHRSLIREMARAADLKPVRFDLLEPRVQIYGDTGIVTFTRLTTYGQDGHPRWTAFNETRVFIREGGAWKMAHFHRSPA